jgi:hypothetical protein
MRTLISFFAFSLLLNACGNNPQPITTNTAEEIVESTSPELGDNAWRLSAEPVLTIGSKEGSEQTQFYRVFSAIQMGDNTIVISNSGTHELRFFSEKGNFIKSVGQNGKGPGDFGDWSSMRLYKNGTDSFIVNDNNNDRVQVFDANGELIKVNTMEKIEGAGNPQVNDVFTDNSFLIWSTVGPAGHQGNPGEIIQSEYGLHRVLEDWTYDKILFKVKSRPKFVNQFRGVTNYPHIPLTSEPLYKTDSKNAALFSSGTEASIIRVDTTGVKTHLYTWNVPRIETDDIWQRYKQEYYVDNMTEERKAQYEHYLSEDLPIPKYAPAISDIKLDTEGNIWVQRFSLPWHQNETWDILNSEGNWLTNIDIPNHLTITELGSDYILGYTYKNGYQQIVKHSLLKD